MRSVQFFKLVAGFSFLVATSYSYTVNAASVLQLIQPNKKIQQGLEFKVVHIPIYEGHSLQSKFLIEITPIKTQIPSNFKANLSSIRMNQKSTEIKGVREINCSAEQTIICNFTVSNAILHDSDLGFVLEIPVFVSINKKQIRMPSYDFFYFKLKDIPMSDFSCWIKFLHYIAMIAT